MTSPRQIKAERLDYDKHHGHVIAGRFKLYGQHPLNQ